MNTRDSRAEKVNKAQRGSEGALDDRRGTDSRTRSYNVRELSKYVEKDTNGLLAQQHRKALNDRDQD